MKVQKINQYKDQFKTYLQSAADYPHVYKYEVLSNFRKNWDLAALDLSTMFDNSLRSQLSARLWGGRKDSAKEMMLQFIETNKEFVRSIFRDLFNEAKEVSNRVDRFIFHCDQLLEELQIKGIRQDKHYHETPKMAFLYLCMNNPQSYPLYDFDQFKKALMLFEVRQLPEPFQINKYHILSKSIYTIIKKDEELVNQHLELIPEHYGVETNYLLLDDFMMFCNDIK